jgi:biotin transport system substrate-specific component
MREVVLVVGTSIAIGAVAQLEIRLPWTPIPVTLQPLAVFIAGAALGSRRAAAAIAAYLLQGAVGLPVFAGGASGVAHLLGPSGGYLFGFLPAAFAIGFLAERGWDRSPVRAFVAMCAGSVLLFVCGLLQLAVYIPRDQLLAAGLYPFVVGDLLKMAAAAALLPAAWKLLGRTGTATGAKDRDTLLAATLSLPHFLRST